jgi:hypothetical protein
MNSCNLSSLQSVSINGKFNLGWCLEALNFEQSITAVKPHDEPCLDKCHAVIYRGLLPRLMMMRAMFSSVVSGWQCVSAVISYLPAPLIPASLSASLLFRKKFRKVGAVPGTLRAVSETKGSAHKADSGVCC